MRIHVFITIDTEEDSWGDYASGENSSVENVYRIPLIQDVFDRFGAIPTYLVTYPVIKDDRSAEILGDIVSNGHCEIGTHCHPWNTPPFVEETNAHNSMLSNLPDHLVQSKLESLHRAVVDRLSVTPVCFRAGRWGYGPGVARAIRDLGYHVDSSVTPFTSWSEYGGPDFSTAPVDLYRFNPSEILEASKSGSLMEVPASIGFFQRNYRLCAFIRQCLLKKPFSRTRALGLLDRLGLLNLRWLSPESSTGPEMIRLAKSLVHFGLRYLNVTFHSTALLPGSSPYVQTESELGSFIRNLELFLADCRQNGMRFSPLSEAVSL